MKDKLNLHLKTDDLGDIELLRVHAEPSPLDSTANLHLNKNYKTKVKFNELYKLVRILGAGGFGIVVHAKCRQTQRNLALKITQHSLVRLTSAARSL